MKNKLWIVIIAVCVLGTGVLAPAASAAKGGVRVLQAGMTGEDIKQVQAQLIQQGYNPGDADGIFGEVTQSAVIAFQQANKLSVDGIVGTDTFNALRGKTGTVTKPSRGDVPRYKNAYDIVATAYAPGYEDNGKWGNLTHLGTQVRPGVIAVDPKLIPLGSRVYIKFANGKGMYAVAEDTGGAIKGNRIDIAFADRHAAKDFGIQNVQVYVL